MLFPAWVDSPKHRDRRASLRLKHMLSLAALHKYGRTSMHDLARDVGCNHSSIFNAIKRGHFTPEMALAIEFVVGRSILKHEMLINPLEIKTVEAK